MAIKVFISSVSDEFDDERRALQELIGGLESLFVGMELFGSDSKSPASYCEERVRASDLYVGLIGYRYGSVDEQSQKSFTELEYDAAIDASVPCLIYLKPEGEGTSHSFDRRQAEFRERLRRNHIAANFKDINDLKYRFLIDLFKLSRGTLFDKAGPLEHAPFPANALQSLTQGLIREQIKSVGQDKYISEIYIEREASKELERFITFEETFLNRAGEILGLLEIIGSKYNLSERVNPPLMRLRSALKCDTAPAAMRGLLVDLRTAFYFEEVEGLIRKINSIVVEPSGRQYELMVYNMMRQLNGLPFIEALALSELPETMFEVRKQSALAGALQIHSASYKELLTIFPAYKQGHMNVQTANELLIELVRLSELNASRCIVLVDRAGRGKTNLMCHMAQQMAESFPVILLSGQLESRDEFAVETHVQQLLEAEFRGVFSDWMNRVSVSLQAEHKWLLILIDGINENGDLPRLLKALKSFLPRTESRRVKLILSCRDLFWDYFQPALKPFLFDDKTVALNEFTEREWHRAVEVYFKRFDIECTLDRRAEEALHNPLLLRFFCEAHRGQQLGSVSNLRLLSIFDLYIERIKENISQRTALLRHDAVIGLLLKAASAMWDLRQANVDLQKLGVTPQEMSDSASVYNQILSENIILEETTHAYSMRKSVRFLYDEFMEYMIARSWVERLASSWRPESEADGIINDAIESLRSFPAAFGSIFFFDQMMKRNGSLINKAVARIIAKGDSFMMSQQIPLLYAFEKINFAHVDKGLIDALEKFEHSARNEVKEQLAPVILKIMKTHPDHPFVRGFVERIFGKGSGIIPATSTSSPKQQVEAGKSSYSSRDRTPFAPYQFVPIEKRLPPSSYHYTEETKLNAIGVLVSIGNRKDYALIEEGIRGLGRASLHSALKAFEYLDLADDDFIYNLVSNYLKAAQPEYRIYCAWLLRRRYGAEPADFLLRLLTDPDTRVHRYTYGLFDERGVEAELIERILNEIRSKGRIPSWHLLNLVKLLGRRKSLRPMSLAISHGLNIVKGLMALTAHDYASVRLSVYRAMLNYREFVNLPALLNKMQADSDIYIKSLADKLKAQD